MINSTIFDPDSVDKQWTITCGDITITNEDIHDDISIEESICSESNLKIGSCESACFQTTISNLYQPLIGKMISVVVTVDDTAFPIGQYIIEEDTPTADRASRQIVGYDVLHTLFDTDVTDWYNSLTFPITLKNFRDAFFDAFEIEQKTATLVNDSINLTKTVTDNYVNGKTILTAICELGGCFGHIGRDGKFEYKVLSEMVAALYPSNTLYPDDDLFPASEIGSFEIAKEKYIGITYEDYTTERIGGVSIINDSGETLVDIGSGNKVIIEGNPLMPYENSASLQTVANNILSVVNGLWYRPCTIQAKGNPCVEVGDGIRVWTKNEIIYTYVMRRRITGTQSLRDEYEAQGEQTQKRVKSAMQTKVMKVGSKLDKSGGTANTFSWELSESAWSIKSGNTEVLRMDSTGLSVTGSGTFSGQVGSNGIVSTGLQGTARLGDGYLDLNNGTSNGYVAANQLSIGALAASPDTAWVNNGVIVTSANIGSYMPSSVDYATQSGYAFSSSQTDLLAPSSSYPSSGVWVNYGASAFVPYDSDAYSCGGSSRKWTDIYCSNDTIITSDRRVKTEIADLTQKHLDFILSIAPRSYQFIDGHGRTHIGFIAQEIEAAMARCGLTDLDFAGFIKSPVYEKEDDPTSAVIDYIYGLRYGEFIALLTLAIQEQNNRLNAIEERLSRMEAFNE